MRRRFLSGKALFLNSHLPCGFPHWLPRCRICRHFLRTGNQLRYPRPTGPRKVEAPEENVPEGRNLICNGFTILLSFRRKAQPNLVHSMPEAHEVDNAFFSPQKALKCRDATDVTGCQERKSVLSGFRRQPWSLNSFVGTSQC